MGNFEEQHWDILSGRVGTEAAKSVRRRLQDGFYGKFLSGTAVLDIGYRGGNEENVPITKSAIGVDLDYPGYDGRRLPFPDSSQDAVFSSHCLEHIADYATALRDWSRVLKSHHPHAGRTQSHAIAMSADESIVRQSLAPAAFRSQVQLECNLLRGSAVGPFPPQLPT